VLPGQPVVVEDPTFPGALDALYRAGARVLRIPAGAGLDPDRLEHVVRTHRPALVYLVPTHHNPTGLVMPAGHRRRVARLAAAHPDTLFVDDMTLAELPLGDHPAPAPAGRPRSRAAEPGQRRLAVQAVLGRPADRLDQGQHGPDRPGRRGQGSGRPGQRHLPAGDRGRRC
jgi:Transcriptional regulators containing a DNA-binding HTH domain and an aminotransferase domain (MocR family) and their eukaryotic orthologs